MEKIIKIKGEKAYFLKNTSPTEAPSCLTFELETDQSSLTLFGIFSLIGEGEHSLKIKILHKAPHSRANIQLLSILDNSAQFNLKCKTVVEANAFGSSETLLHHSLLLDSASRSFTTPEQEISAEDCECSHDLMIESLDQNQLLYLKSKGILVATAQKIQLDSFTFNLLQDAKNSQFDDILLSF